MLQVTRVFEFIIFFFHNLTLGILCLLTKVHCGVGWLPQPVSTATDEQKPALSDPELTAFSDTDIQ